MSILAQAKDLLKMHGGSCSVPEDSRFGAAFKLIEQSGEVVIKPSGTVGYIDVYDPDFKPKFNGENDQ